FPRMLPGLIVRQSGVCVDQSATDPALRIVFADPPDFMRVIIRNRAIVGDEKKRLDAPLLNFQRLPRYSVDIMHRDRRMQDSPQRKQKRPLHWASSSANFLRRFGSDAN